MSDPDIITTLNSYDPETRQVSATFVYKGVTHTRFVNAVMSPNDNYDEHGTELRLKDVARGVVHKIDMGAITNPPAPEPTPPPAPAPDPED